VSAPRHAPPRAVAARTSLRPARVRASATPGANEHLVVERIVRVTAWTAVLLVAVQTLVHLTNALALDYRVWNMSADADGNALSWLSSTTTFTAALAAAAVAVARPEVRRRTAALAVLLAFFSFDDIVAIHEAVGEHVTGQLPVRGELARVVWPAIFFPLLAFVAVVLLQVRRLAPARAGRLLTLALAMLLVAIVAEAAWATWFVAGGAIETTPDAIEVAVEEGLELAAWVLVAGALVATAVSAGRGAGEGAAAHRAVP
jgi:hypothetical protein